MGAAEYRKLEREAHDYAQKAVSPELQRVWQEIAEGWSTLAERAEPYEASKPDVDPHRS